MILRAERLADRSRQGAKALPEELDELNRLVAEDEMDSFGATVSPQTVIGVAATFSSRRRADTSCEATPIASVSSTSEHQPSGRTAGETVELLHHGIGPSLQLGDNGGEVGPGASGSLFGCATLHKR